jgi:hypothetical protein
MPWLPNVGLGYQKTGDGFTAVVTLPLDLTGLKLKDGPTLRMNLGYIYDNATGNGSAARSYLFNNSATANILNDVPHESRLEPTEWGEAEVN